MTNNNFDREMAGILKRMKVPYDVGSWDRLESKLEEKEGEDAIFDMVIADKLKSFAVPVSMSSFDKLESKLDTDDSFRRDSYKYKKLVGIAAAIFLLVSGLIFINNNNTPKRSSIATISKENDSSFVKKGKSITIDKIKSSEVLSKPYVFKKHNKIETVKTKPNYLGDLILPDYSNISINNNYGLSMDRVNNLYSKQIYHNESSKYYNTLSSGIVFSVRLSVSSNNAFASNNNPPVNRKDNTDYFENSNSKSLDNEIAFDEKQSKSEKIIIDKNIIHGEANDDSSIQFVSPSRKVDNGLSLNAHIFPSANLIKTPNDIIFNIPGYNQVEKGVGGGLAISYKKNKHEIESGLDVVNLKYSPRKIILKHNSSSFFLDKIEYLQVRIPLVHKYHIVENKKWDIYTIAGVAVNTMLESNYVFTENTLDQEGNKHILSHLASDLQENFDFKNTLYYKKEYRKGVNDGAKLNDNLFVSANIGLGLKRKLHKGYSITFEPQYNYNFKGLGPNNDMISSLEFKLGISKSINL